MKKKHVNEDYKYQCNYCKYQTDVIVRMYRHKFEDHPEIPVGFTQQNIPTNDSGLNFLAEQNMKMMSVIIGLKEDVKILTEKVNSNCKVSHEARTDLHVQLDHKKKEDTTKKDDKKGVTTEDTLRVNKQSNPPENKRKTSYLKKTKFCNMLVILLPIVLQYVTWRK